MYIIKIKYIQSIMQIFNTKRNILKIWSFGFFIAFFLLLPIYGYALSLGGIGIMPGQGSGHRDWFIYDLKPGEQQEDYVDVMNNTDQEQYITVRPYDSEASNIGGFALSGPNREQKGIGLWVQLEEEKITLVPGEVRRLKFTLTVPLTADVGEHSGAITAQGAPKELKGKSGIAIGTRVGARIYVTVPGKIIKKAKLISFTLTDWKERGYIQLDLTAKNEGNVTITPISRLNVGGWGLEKRYKIFHDTTPPPKGFELMRNTEVSTNWQWHRPYFGYYTFQVVMEYEDENNVMQKITTDTLSLFIVPWKDAAIFGSILLMVLIIIIAWIIYRKKKYSRKGWDEYKVKENDNIMALAQKHSIPWKTMVKVNRIKKPYFLMPGQTIFAPPSKEEKEKTPAGKTEQKAGKKEKRDIMKWVFLIAITILTAAAMVVAIILFIQSMDKSKENVNKAPVITQENIVFGGSEAKPSPIESPSATSAAATTATQATTTLPLAQAKAPTTTEPYLKILVDKDTIHISILNGSGIKGYAGKIANILKKDGYKEITFGNAERFDYKDAAISYIEGFKDTAENIQALMIGEYKNFVLKQVEKQGSAIVVILGIRSKN